MSPLGLIILGVIAVIAIFVLLYLKVAWFRDAVDTALRAIVGFFRAAWHRSRALSLPSHRVHQGLRAKDYRANPVALHRRIPAHQGGAHGRVVWRYRPDRQVDRRHRAHTRRGRQRHFWTVQGGVGRHPPQPSNPRRKHVFGCRRRYQSRPRRGHRRHNRPVLGGVAVDRPARPRTDQGGVERHSQSNQLGTRQLARTEKPDNERPKNWGGKGFPTSTRRMFPCSPRGGFLTRSGLIYAHAGEVAVARPRLAHPPGARLSAPRGTPTRKRTADRQPRRDGARRGGRPARLLCRRRAPHRAARARGGVVPATLPAPGIAQIEIALGVGSTTALARWDFGHVRF